MNRKTITIYGAGYVGLVTAVCFAELNNQVLVIDIDEKKIFNLSQGISPLYEPDLDELIRRHTANGHLKFSTDIGMGVAFGFFQFIAVGTPSLEDGSPDLQQVYAVADAIGEHISEYRLVINKSTAPIGTVKQIQQHIKTKIFNRGFEIEFDVIANPEFLAQGAAIRNFMYPDRIIIGADNERAAKLAAELYAPIDNSIELLKMMDVASAELTKYAANAYLAMRISFINEMSQVAERVGADIEYVRQGVGSDRRIGPHFLHAGCGFGGSCFPKDVSALKWMTNQLNYESALLNAIEVVNQRQKNILFEKVYAYFKGEITGKVIALWGLSFKPETDDMREASSRVLINKLLLSKAIVQAYDPAAGKVAAAIYQGNPNFKLFLSSYDALNNADILVVVTEWNEFRNPDFEKISKKLRYPAVFDGRNLYKSESLVMHGLKYFAIGRGDKLYECSEQ